MAAVQELPEFFGVQVMHESLLFGEVVVSDCSYSSNHHNKPEQKKAFDVKNAYVVRNQEEGKRIP